MHPRTGETLYVFGLSWWPFDGAVTAALIALAGTVSTLLINVWRFSKAETNQTNRHSESLAASNRTSERALLVQDMQRAEEALAGDDQNRWVYAAVILQEVNRSPHATDADRRRARIVLKAFNARVTPAS